MRGVSREVKNRILLLLKEDKSVRQIAKECSVSHPTVIRIRKSSGTEPSSSKGGRPRKLSERQCREMGRLLASETAKSPKEAAVMVKAEASEWTVRRSLKKIGVKAHKKIKKPALSAKNILARKQYAERHKDWTIDDWKQVIWSDESKFCRFESGGQKWFWSKGSTAIQPGRVKQTMKFGGGSIMVWGCLTKNGVGPLVKIDGIMTKETYLAIIQQNLPIAFEKSGLSERRIIFQHDGDPKHTAKIVTAWLQQQKFKVLKWPPQSPDMNPIEHVWGYIKKHLANYVDPPLE